MKILFFASLVFAASHVAFAADRDLGAVFAVERSYDFDMSACRSNWTGYSCTVQVPRNSQYIDLDEKYYRSFSLLTTTVMFEGQASWYRMSINRPPAASGSLTFADAEPLIMAALNSSPGFGQVKVRMLDIR